MDKFHNSITALVSFLVAVALGLDMLFEGYHGLKMTGLIFFVLLGSYIWEYREDKDLNKSGPIEDILSMPWRMTSSIFRKDSKGDDIDFFD